MQRCTDKHTSNIICNYLYISIISRSVIFRMKNISEESCRENQNTYFIFNDFFENRTLYFIMWKKNTGVRQTTDENEMRHMRTACLINKATNTNSGCNPFCSFLCKMSCMNAPPYYVILTLPFLLNIIFIYFFIPLHHISTFFTILNLELLWFIFFLFQPILITFSLLIYCCA